MGRSKVTIEDYVPKADVAVGQTLRDIVSFINDNHIQRNNIVSIFKESCYYLVYLIIIPKFTLQGNIK